MKFCKKCILDRNIFMYMNRKICRVHRSPWPHVRRAGSKKVPSDGCCYRVLPCKVVDYSVIIIFLDLISSWYNLLTSAWMGVYCVRVWKRRLTLRMHIKTELRRYHTILCLCTWLIMKSEEKTNVWEAFTRACQTALSTTLKNDEKEGKTETNSGRIHRSLLVRHLHRKWNTAKNQRMACI